MIKEIQIGNDYTLDEIKAAGYIYGEASISRGYVKRESKAEAAGTRTYRIQQAGGRRKGQIYIDLPFYTSTQYHIRQYLVRVRFGL